VFRKGVYEAVTGAVYDAMADAVTRPRESQLADAFKRPNKNKQGGRAKASPLENFGYKQTTAS